MFKQSALKFHQDYLLKQLKYVGPTRPDIFILL